MKRSTRLLLGIALVFFMVFGVTKITLAWLEDNTKEITNKFTLGTVTSEVIEKFDGQTKKDVSIQNTGNINAYMRVALIPIWKNADGSISGTPVGTEYTAPLAPEGWFLGSDGFYYHQSFVTPGENTTVLINEISMPTKPELYFELQILASAIQADPKQAVEESWPVNVGTDRKLIGGGP